MEPLARTYREIGKLCAAWSHLEHRTEATLWGILGLDASLGPLISWKQDLRGRWQLIIDHASKKHDEKDVASLRSINKDIITAIRDRNIIIHGLVHARMALPSDLPRGSSIPGGNCPIYPMTSLPCWTVFRGEEKGKSFPISTEAVKIVVSNINKIGERLNVFNVTHNYHEASNPSTMIEQNWPKQLP